MPMFKKNRVMRKKTIKSKPSKKPIVKKTVSPLVRATGALSRVTLHHNTMLKSLFDHCYMGYQRCTEGESLTGYQRIYLDTTLANSKILPMHVYELTGIINDGYAPTAYSEMNVNSSDYPWFQDIDSYTFLGANNSGGYQTTQNFNRTIQEYFDVRLQLFGRLRYKTVWNVMLLKIFDEDLVPKGVASSDPSQAKHNNFWKHLVRPYYTNPLIPSDPRVMTDLKGKFKIVWQKEYKFRDSDASFDEVQTKTVKIFKKLNQLNKYSETPEQKNYTDDNPNTVFQSAQAGNASVRCQVPNRWYLVIRANQTKDYNVGTNTWDAGASVPESGDICSYNVYIRTKHMNPQNPN